MFFFYGIAAALYRCLIYIASPFNKKANLAVKGRKRQVLKTESDKYVWFHCSSLGEFEQGRPLIELFKNEYPEKKVLLTFYSPSGLENARNYSNADVITYLPFDGRRNARKFLDQFQIEKAVFVKYDLWPFFIRELNRRGIPTFLVSTTFRSSQYYFKWYGKFMLKLMTGFQGIFCQNESSLKIADKVGLTNTFLTGDLRVDSVIKVGNQHWEDSRIEKFKDNQTTILFGSVWPEDEKVVELVMKQNPEVKFIIAPHNIANSYVDHLVHKFSRTIAYADYKGEADFQVMVIDFIGSLKQLYRYGNVAYVGGGFGTSVHNLLEPAVYGIPVFFGPKHHRFQEAQEFIRLKMGFSAENPHDIAQKINEYIKKLHEDKVGEIANNWFEKSAGATQLTFREIFTEKDNGKP